MGRHRINGHTTRFCTLTVFFFKARFVFVQNIFGKSYFAFVLSGKENFQLCVCLEKN